ncbi:MAG: hypothetical protein WB785_20590 [Mycobacterium sp.]|uniref:hypothetical protein n=1 Tax=Mycobacterium sp. TaxID=1785 RepID=UPI003C5F9C02
MTLVVGTAAGAFLAAGLIPLANTPVAHAICAPDDSLGCDADFIFATDPILKMFGITDIGAADPDDNFEGMIFNIPSMGITDVLTSGKDSSDLLAGLGIPIPDDTGIGMAGVSVNTFVDTMNPALDSSFIIPFEDPLAQLWDFLVANAFFGL